jgi:glycosyltransferase involved in cell wall biosynthesis
MKVVVLDAALRENGGMRVMMDLASRWQGSGTATTVFVMQRVAGEARVTTRARLVYGQRRVGRLRQGLPLVVARCLAAARGADVIVSNSEAGLHMLLATVAARVLRRPLVVIVHTPLEASIRDWVPRPLRRLTLAAVRTADATICVSRGVADAALACGLRPDRVHVVTNGIDVAAVRARAAHTPPADLPAPLVVGVGRLSSQKGFDLLIRAHATAVHEGAPHHLMIIGEGPDRAELTSLAASLGVSETVSLPGFRDNPHAILRQADLFCLSSRYEGHPLVLIEALAVGVPLVATDCVSGPAEILAGGTYGDLVPTGSARALADAIGHHLRDPQRLRALAALGPERAAAFDPDACAARYVEIFASLPARRRRRAGSARRLPSANGRVPDAWVGVERSISPHRPAAALPADKT